MPFVERTTIIKALASVCYLIASDMEQYPEFMSDVESVKVVERGDNYTLTDWETSVDGTPILWREKDVFHPKQLLITYQLIEGDLDKFEGEWRFEETSGVTKVTLTCSYDFGIPELTHMIGPTLDQKVTENCDMMLAGLKKQAEMQ